MFLCDSYVVDWEWWKCLWREKKHRVALEIDDEMNEI